MYENSSSTVQQTASDVRIKRIALLLVMIVIISGSSVLMFLFVRTTRLTGYSNGTATAALSTTAKEDATSIAQTKVAGTEITTSRATATVASVPDPYANGKLMLYDPLTTDQSTTQSWRWEQDSTCAFQGNAYHVTDVVRGYLVNCELTNDGNSVLNFSDFTLEVKMTILKGDEGGITFRQVNQPGYLGYRILFDKDSNYRFLLSTSSDTKELMSGASSAFHTGYGQTNTIGLVARGRSFTWYVNDQSAGSVSDSTYQLGSFDLEAATFSGHTEYPEVAYSNFKIWRL
ncbi:hypothetical protein KSF_096510 [Reticulibacter mediterranei]|uniref:3-keto-disaccharide hydrolase domain-containing protein n=1 Tax=Reticulibacter mediterranei TaxID=2778369 RepID=A0A8J3ISG1_9CHLR|nr:hypothetical protein [Reticulibacter mediterranei]GHO99603.1 hypothetical protein KSF_096510 [Reticulibacter mediterranei]